MQTKKPRDEAQRWRAFKNITRFHRNALGYIYWKTLPYFSKNRFRLVYALLFYHMWNTWMLMAQCRDTKTTAIEHYAYATGRSSEMYRGLSTRYRMP